MKKTILLLMILVTGTLSSTAQTDSLETKENLLKQKEEILLKEKDALKKEVENINLRLEQNELSKNQADSLKQVVAEKRAKNIENQIAIIENKIELLERNLEDIGEAEEQDTISVSKKVVINIRNNRSYKRTTSGPVIAFGLNNVITEGESFDNSQFKVGGSRFFEIGWSWKSRLLNDSNWLRVKYGINFQFNGLKPLDNKTFVDMGEHTELQEFAYPLEKSKFRMDNLVIPIHLEFGPSSKTTTERGTKYNTAKKFRTGLGGYAGVNLGARQKLIFTEDGKRRKQKIKEDYNSANLIYGLSGYIGWSSFSLYTKYDLNPLFRNNPKTQHNISVGLRFDWD